MSKIRFITKKRDKIVVDLAQMKKEKLGDVSLLYMTKYSRHKWFIHIFSIPRTPKVIRSVSLSI